MKKILVIAIIIMLATGMAKSLVASTNSNPTPCFDDTGKWYTQIKEDSNE